MLYFLVSWLVHLTPVISTYSELHYMEMYYANFAELKNSIYQTVQDLMKFDKITSPFALVGYQIDYFSPSQIQRTLME